MCRDGVSDKRIGISTLKFLCLTVMLSMGILLTGCGEEKVIHPVEVVTSDEDSEGKEDAKEDVNQENAEDESAIEDSEEAASDEDDLPGEAEPEEEFNLLEIDEPEAEEDDKGNVVTYDGKIVVDLVFFMGQSNMSGVGGNAEDVPVVLEGHGYEFKAISDPTAIYTIVEPFGKNESFIGGICDVPGAKKGSIVSCFANEYYAQTGVPIVGVSASQGASTTEIWLTPSFQADMKQRYDRSVEWLENNGYYIRNKYAVWFQGESDAANHVTPETYVTNMDNIIRPMFISGLTKVFIITPGRTLSIKKYFSDIINEQLRMCKESGYYALGTNILSDISAEYMVDEWHYNQKVLNLIGIETAKSVAYYTLNREERLDYNYEEDCTFIPDGYDYSENEEVEPIDLSDIQKLLDNYWEDYISRGRAEE